MSNSFDVLFVCALLKRSGGQQPRAVSKTQLLEGPIPLTHQIRIWAGVSDGEEIWFQKKAKEQLADGGPFDPSFRFHVSCITHHASRPYLLCVPSFILIVFIRGSLSVPFSFLRFKSVFIPSCLARSLRGAEHQHLIYETNPDGSGWRQEGKRPRHSHAHPHPRPRYRWCVERC